MVTNRIGKRNPDGIRGIGRQNDGGIIGSPHYRSPATTSCRYCGAKAGAYCTMPDGSRRSEVHSVRVDDWRNSRTRGEWVGRLLSSNPALDLFEGDLVLLRGYSSDRLEILRRIIDGHDPEAFVGAKQTHFVRESKAAERKITAQRVTSESYAEERYVDRLYREGLNRYLTSML